MSELYKDFYHTVLKADTINAHTHHKAKEELKDQDLDKIIKNSYVVWKKDFGFETTAQSRKDFIEKIKYNSFYVWLLKGIKAIYGIEEDLTAENWEKYNLIISEKYSRDPDWDMKLFTGKDYCNYKKSILDAYWMPGSDNMNPDVFAPSFRIDPEFTVYDPEFKWHDRFSATMLYGEEFQNLDDFLEFEFELIKKKIAGGCVAIKNAKAYDRGLNYKSTDKSSAEKVFRKKDYTEEDVKKFQDYFFYSVCDMAAQLDVPIQVHTGTGCLDKTRAIYLLDIIKDNPGTKFSLLHVSFPWCEDIQALMSMYSNVYVDMVWLPMLDPMAAENVLHGLIETRSSERIMWGCDTWNSEESYGAKIAMAETLAHVLEEKVKRKYMTEESAYSIIDKIMFQNAKSLFSGIVL